jgi:hypothetical protein
MSWKATLAVALLFVAAPAFAAGPPQVAQAETPGEALGKVQTKKETTARPRLINAAGGLFEVSNPNDDLSEPIPSGTRSDFERRGYEIVEEGKVEIIVDQTGQIYVDRIYQGVIPGIRNSLSPGELERLQNRDIVLWVGFQPMAALSRLFWLLTDPAPRFEVTRLSDTRLEIFFPGSRVLHTNTVRPLLVEHFGGPIQQVVGKRVRGGVRYVVDLKRPANYLYRFEAPFLYLDFEREGM